MTSPRSMRHEEEEITRKATAMVVAEDDLDDEEEEEDDDDSVAEEEQDATNLNPPDSRDSSVHSSMQSSLGNEEEEDDDEGNTEDEDENENEDGRTLMTICNQAVEEDADIKEIDNDLELHQQLNAEYILTQFYSWNSIINTVCFGGIIYHGILLVWNRRIIYSYVWGNEDDVASSLSSSSLRLVLEAVLALVGWTILYSGRTYYVNPFQTSTHPEQGRIVFGRLLLFVLLSNQLINLVLPQTQHNSHNTNTKRWMDLLTMFAFAIVSRVLWTPRFYRYAIIVSVSCFVGIHLRLDSVAVERVLDAAFSSSSPYYWETVVAVVVALIMVLGEGLADYFMEFQRTTYITQQTTNLKLLLATRTKVETAHELVEMKQRCVALEQEKDVASKMADSMLNHTLKNILADGIASVELFEQTDDTDHLVNSKRAMKRGLLWTRRRQSLIMVCEDNYHLQQEVVPFNTLIRECVDGRDVDIALPNIMFETKGASPTTTTMRTSTSTSTTPPDEPEMIIEVEIDPMLFGLALENGISNALKHNPAGSTRRPLVTARVVVQPSQHDATSSYHVTAESAQLEVVITNDATPGAPIIDAVLEQKLFQEGIHDELTESQSIASLTSLSSRSSHQPPQQKQYRPKTVSTSDGIGLGHSLKMAQLLGGSVSLRQHQHTIAYTLTAPTAVIISMSTPSGPAATTAAARNATDDTTYHDFNQLLAAQAAAEEHQSSSTRDLDMISRIQSNLAVRQPNHRPVPSSSSSPLFPIDLVDESATLLGGIRTGSLSTTKPKTISSNRKFFNAMTKSSKSTTSLKSSFKTTKLKPSTSTGNMNSNRNFYNAMPKSSKSTTSLRSSFKNTVFKPSTSTSNMKMFMIEETAVAAGRSSSTRTRSYKPPERGMFIDDSMIARKYAGRVLMPKILGMKDWFILGENQDQLNLCPAIAAAWKPDIIIIDQNLTTDTDKSSSVTIRTDSCAARTGSIVTPASSSSTGRNKAAPSSSFTSGGRRLHASGDDYILGTQICTAMLRDYHVQGSLVCIRSGNTSTDDIQEYVDAGVHCVICKSYDNTSLKEPLLQGYELLQEERIMIEKGHMQPNETKFPILLLD